SNSGTRAGGAQAGASVSEKGSLPGSRSEAQWLVGRRGLAYAGRAWLTLSSVQSPAPGVGWLDPGATESVDCLAEDPGRHRLPGSTGPPRRGARRSHVGAPEALRVRAPGPALRPWRPVVRRDPR